MRVTRALQRDRTEPLTPAVGLKFSGQLHVVLCAHDKPAGILVSTPTNGVMAQARLKGSGIGFQRNNGRAIAARYQKCDIRSARCRNQMLARFSFT